MHHSSSHPSNMCQPSSPLPYHSCYLKQTMCLVIHIKNCRLPHFWGWVPFNDGQQLSIVYQCWWDFTDDHDQGCITASFISPSTALSPQRSTAIHHLPPDRGQQDCVQPSLSDRKQGHWTTGQSVSSSRRERNEASEGFPEDFRTQSSAEQDEINTFSHHTCANVSILQLIRNRQNCFKML